MTTPTTIKVIVSGGCVQAVYSSNTDQKLIVKVIDTDDLADETSEKEAEAQVKKELEGYTNIW